MSWSFSSLLALINGMFEGLLRLLTLRIRLLPMVIFFSALVLSIKVNQFFHHLQEGGVIQLSEIQATEKPEQQTLPAPNDPKAEKADKKTTPSPSQADVPDFDPLKMSPAEFDVLKNLGERQKKLMKEEAAIPQQEAYLEALVKQLQKQIIHLEKANEELKKTTSTVDLEEKANLEKLVKMVEALKPDKAAAILARIEFSNLIDIMEHIKPKNASSILASMDAEKASYLMNALAERRSKRDKKKKKSS
jgi:flagellar motility protein MotE (MotC chaperone)